MSSGDGKKSSVSGTDGSREVVGTAVWASLTPIGWTSSNVMSSYLSRVHCTNVGHTCARMLLIGRGAWTVNCTSVSSAKLGYKLTTLELLKPPCNGGKTPDELVIVPELPTCSAP